MTTVRKLKQILIAESRTSGEFDTLVARMGRRGAMDFIRARVQKTAKAEAAYKKDQKLRIRYGLTDEPYLDAMSAKGMRIPGCYEGGRRR